MPPFVRRAAAIASVVAVAALTVAGCGSSSKSSSSTTTTSTSGSGGAGQTVDGVRCNRTEQLNYHVHAHLSLIADGSPEALPALIGIPGGSTGTPQCFYFLHTHDTTGVIHIEAPAKTTFTLGQFFAVWGQPLSKDQATNLKGPLHVFVGKKAYTGDPAKIKLTPHGLITIESGKSVPPPSYTFPAGL
jgi:hypothetical protein